MIYNKSNRGLKILKTKAQSQNLLMVLQNKQTEFRVQKIR